MESWKGNYGIEHSYSRRTRLAHMMTLPQYRLKLAKITHEVLHSYNRAYRKRFSDVDLQES